MSELINDRVKEYYRIQIIDGRIPKITEYKFQVLQYLEYQIIVLDYSKDDSNNHET